MEVTHIKALDNLQGLIDKMQGAKLIVICCTDTDLI
jgi:hypothetical protein